MQAERQYLHTLQVSRYCLLHLKSNIVQYLLTLQVSRICLLPFKSIVIHEIMDKSGRTCLMTHSTPPDYSANVVLKFQVD